MTIRYRNSFSEVLMFYIHTLVRSPLVWAIFAIITVVDAPEMWESISEKESDPVEPWVNVVIGALMIAGSFVMTFTMMFVILIASIGMDKKSRLERVVTLTDDALIEEMPLSRNEYKWLGLVGLRRSKSTLILYIGHSESAIIPRRAFENDEQWDAFHKFCEQKLQRA